MGLFDGVLGSVIEGLSQANAGNGTAGGENATLPLIGRLLQQNGGLAGLVETLGKRGLGEQTASWVGTGENQPISADQISQALGNGPLNELAARFGLNSSDLSGVLARYLPEVVNQLTPEGRLPSNENSLEQSLFTLGGRLFG